MQNCNLKLKTLIFLVLLPTFYLLFATSVFAVDFLPLVPCGLSKENAEQLKAEGKGDPDIDYSRPCTRCDTFKLAENVIDFTLKGLVPPVAAVLFIAAGLMILLAGANQSLYANGITIFKSTFWGLVIILSSWMITNTFLKSFAPDQADAPWNKLICEEEVITIPTPTPPPPPPACSQNFGLTPAKGCSGTECVNASNITPTHGCESHEGICLLSKESFDQAKKLVSNFNQLAGGSCTLRLASTIQGGGGPSYSKCHQPGNDKSGTCADFNLLPNHDSCYEFFYQAAKNSKTIVSLLDEYIPACLPANATGGNIHVNFSRPGSTDTPTVIISNVASANVTANTATITWITSVPSTSRINYGTTSNYGLKTALDSNPVTSHSVTISGLTLSTIYNYQAESTASGYTAMSSNYSFTTTGSSANISITSISPTTFPAGKEASFNQNTGISTFTYLDVPFEIKGEGLSGTILYSNNVGVDGKAGIEFKNLKITDASIKGTILMHSTAKDGKTTITVKNSSGKTTTKQIDVTITGTQYLKRKFADNKLISFRGNWGEVMPNQLILNIENNIRRGISATSTNNYNQLDINAIIYEEGFFDNKSICGKAPPGTVIGGCASAADTVIKVKARTDAPLEIASAFLHESAHKLHFFNLGIYKGIPNAPTTASNFQKEWDSLNIVSPTNISACLQLPLQNLVTWGDGHSIEPHCIFYRAYGAFLEQGDKLFYEDPTTMAEYYFYPEVLDLSPEKNNPRYFDKINILKKYGFLP